MTTHQLSNQQITDICRKVELAFTSMAIPEDGHDDPERSGIRCIAEGLYHLRQVHGPAKVRELVAKLVRQSQGASI